MIKEDMASDATKIALIGNNVEYIKKDLAEIKQSVKDLAGVYVTRVEVEDIRKAVDIRVLALENSNNLWKWLSPTLGAVMGAAITFLLVQYITHLK
jgi:hypothetical protein